MATGIEPFIPKISGFLLGLAQKCIVAAVKKWKENADKAAKEEFERVCNDYELGKRIQSRVEQRFTTSLRRLRLSDAQIAQLLALGTNDLLKDELAAQFLAARISQETIVELFLKQDPGLEPARAELLLLASDWLEAIDIAVAEDPQLASIVVMRSQRELRAELESMGGAIARAEVRELAAQKKEDRWRENVGAKLDQIIMGFGLRGTSDGGATIPDSLKNQYQRRFDRARKQLLESSVVGAEREFLGLIEDLEELGESGDSELLMRSYINLGSSQWEQGRRAEAAKWFNKAYELKPTDWRAKRSRAITLMDSDPNAAVELFRAVRTERPDEAEHVCNEATQLKNSGRLGEAIELLESHRFEDDSFYSILALCYLNAERHADAERAAREAIKLDPNAETAQSALAYAIGLPIIQRHMRKESPRVTLLEDEYDRLLEAISLAEKSAITLRKQERYYPLGEILANSVAFYAAVGNCERAIETANEALKINPNDLMTLTNLWCAQMREERYGDAVVTAGRIETLGATVEGWEKKAEALLAAERGDEVLDNWHEKKSDPRFSGSVDVVSLVVRAYSKRHKTQDGIKLLDAALVQHPSDARLLSERGLLMADLGDFEAAQINFATAEKNAVTANRGQFLIDYGMYLYRRGAWKAAAERLKEVGAESIHNPLFTPYLISLFNQGDYRQSMALAESAIAGAKNYREDYYAIAARCHHLCDNLPRAKELLDALVTRGASREVEHRKLLAWICWRLDEVPEAYDVLVKGLKLSARDVDSLLLLSAVCLALRKPEEAFLYATKAVELAPLDVRAHSALVNVAFSCPPDFKPEQKHLDAHFKSLTFLQQHESKIVRAVPVEPDLRSILALLKARSQHASKLENIFQNQKLPMGFFAEQLGVSVIGLWEALIAHRKLRIRMAFGNNEEQQNEFNAASTTDSIAVDLFALLTLQHLNLLWLLPKIFRKIYAHSSLLDAVIGDIREIKQHPKRGSLRYEDGKIVRFEHSPEQSATQLARLYAVRDFLKSPAVTLTGLLPDTLNVDHRALLSDGCGMVSIAPVFVAVEKSVACYSDDAVLRAVARLDCKVPGFCTQAILRVARTQGYISPTIYQDAVLTLLTSNYFFVSEDGGTLRRGYERAGGRIDPLCKAIINRVNDSNCNAQSCIPLLAEFVAQTWRDRGADGAQPREEWIAEVWRAIIKAKESESLLFEFIGKLAVACSTHPATFAGIINFGLMHVVGLRHKRAEIYVMAQQAIKTMSGLSLQFFPFWPELSRRWVAQGRVNRILDQQGFLKLL